MSSNSFTKWMLETFIRQLWDWFKGKTVISQKLYVEKTGLIRHVNFNSDNFMSVNFSETFHWPKAGLQDSVHADITN